MQIRSAMGRYDFRLDLPSCIICNSSFDCVERVPVTQACNHSVCSPCLVAANQTPNQQLKCPQDELLLNLDVQAINLPLLTLIQKPQAPHRTDFNLVQSQSNQPMVSKSIKLICSIASQLRDSPDLFSPQQTRRLLQLIQSYHWNRIGQLDDITKLASIFDRLLFELIQVHHSTKRREMAVTRMLDKKNCHIFEPKLTDDVIEIIIKLYRAAGDGHLEQSFQRAVLNKFLINRLGEQNKSVIERIVQTLLWCNCFDVVKMDNAPSRFKLKSNIKNAYQMREQHDNEIIRKIRDDQGNPIRLSPESWASLLHGEVSPRIVANMQSLLDKNRLPVTVQEVDSTIKSQNGPTNLTDQYDVGHLKRLECHFSQQTHLMSDKEIESLLCSVLEDMAPWFPLLASRRLRQR